MASHGRTTRGRRGAALLSAAALALACKFGSEGLGEASGADAGASEAATAGGPPTSSGPSTSGVTADAGATGTAPATTEPPPNCGDGVKDADEACDDGDDNGDDRACTPVCTVNVCGDGYALADVEACDDGNDEVTDGCIACEVAWCGDGHVYKNVESCDGAGESADCDADCSKAACGDGAVNAAAGEKCDLGAMNGLYGGACNKTCDGPGPACGDGAIDPPDEVCDEGIPPVNHVLCINACKAVTCQPDWDNCDGDPGNGCETDLMSDKHHCGDCGTDCYFLVCKNGNCSA